MVVGWNTVSVQDILLYGEHAVWYSRCTTVRIWLVVVYRGCFVP